MRGLKTTDTPILSGIQMFHNYIHGHESLAGYAPSEACGIGSRVRTNGKLFRMQVWKKE
jgi:hypothetical protein